MAADSTLSREQVTGPGDPRPGSMLTGYRVLDLTQFVAGPTCTRILAELGAEVIKVELAPLGDRSRIQGMQARQGQTKIAPHSTYFFQHNHSKKCLALDFKSGRGRELIRSLVEKSDVLVENFAPGVMARAGLGYEDLRKINPRLIMCSISFAGQSGPLSGKPGYDYIGQAYAGITGLIGDPAGSPSMITMAIGDVTTGHFAAMAIGFALLHRERTGQGQYIESTLLDTYFQMHEANVPRVSLRGDSFVPQRTGSQHPDGGPTGIYRCGDGQYITVMVLSHQWPQFVAALGMPELLEDQRFATARARRENNAALQDIFEAWLAKLGTREAGIAALEKHRVPCAPVLTLNQAMAEPHLRERGTVRRVSDPQLGSFDIPGMPVKFSDWPGVAAPAAGVLGQDNERILQDVLGIAPSEIEELYAANVLVSAERKTGR